jgi:hypothetical protein
VPILAAIAAVLLAAGTDKIESWFSDPRPRVAVDHKGNEFLIKLETHNPTSGIAISFPVSGRIINVEDLNSRADAVVLSKDVVGHDIPESNNDVEIVLADVKPNRPLSFKILYEPMQMKIKTAGRDRWQFSYSWLHGGSTITKTKWYLIADNSEVGPPPVQTKGLVIYPRALSPEEMKKEYKKGLPRTLLK